MNALKEQKVDYCVGCIPLLRWASLNSGPNCRLEMTEDHGNINRRVKNACVMAETRNYQSSNFKLIIKKKTNNPNLMCLVCFIQPVLTNVLLRNQTDSGLASLLQTLVIVAG